jgi:hypothetical protein
MSGCERRPCSKSRCPMYVRCPFGPSIISTIVYALSLASKNRVRVRVEAGTMRRLSVPARGGQILPQIYGVCSYRLPRWRVLELSRTQCANAATTESCPDGRNTTCQLTNAGRARKLQQQMDEIRIECICSTRVLQTHVGVSAV